MTFIIDGTAGATFPNGTNPQAAPSKVLQVVNATYSTDASTASSTFSSTGLTASITPLFSTSKILIFISANGVMKYNTNTALGLQIVRNSTAILTFEGSAGFINGGTPQYIATGGNSIEYLDSPATTSATTYTLYFASTGNLSNVHINYNAFTTQPVSTITLMEIAQ